MLLVRILAPNALVLNAESNERDQHTSMRIMGENLAKEIYRCVFTNGMIFFSLSF